MNKSYFNRIRIKKKRKKRNVDDDYDYDDDDNEKKKRNLEMEFTKKGKTSICEKRSIYAAEERNKRESG